MNAIIRYLFKVDAYSLPDDEWALLWREAEYIMKTFRPVSQQP